MATLETTPKCTPYQTSARLSDTSPMVGEFGTLLNIPLSRSSRPWVPGVENRDSVHLFKISRHPDSDVTGEGRDGLTMGVYN